MRRSAFFSRRISSARSASEISCSSASTRSVLGGRREIGGGDAHQRPRPAPAARADQPAQLHHGEPSDLLDAADLLVSVLQPRSDLLGPADQALHVGLAEVDLHEQLQHRLAVRLALFAQRLALSFGPGPALGVELVGDAAVLAVEPLQLAHQRQELALRRPRGRGGRPRRRAPRPLHRRHPRFRSGSCAPPGSSRPRRCWWPARRASRRARPPRASARCRPRRAC